MGLYHLFLTLLRKRIAEHRLKKYFLRFVETRLYKRKYLTILRRRILDFYRSYYRDRTRPPQSSGAKDPGWENIPADAGALEKLDHRLDLQRALSFFSRYDPIRRECMTLYWRKGFSFAAIARKLNVTEGNVRYHVKKGTEQLRRWMEEPPADEEEPTPDGKSPPAKPSPSEPEEDDEPPSGTPPEPDAK